METPVNRQYDKNRRARIFGLVVPRALDPNAAPVGVYDAAGDGQSQARTAAFELGLAGGVQEHLAGLVELFEHKLLVLRVDAASGVRAANLGGSGDISGFMLNDERIFFSGNSILIRAAAGDFTSGVSTTGYLGANGSPARYEIGGLAITGQAITGFTAYAFDGFATSSFTGLQSPGDPASLVQLTSPGTLSFDLSSIIFVSRAGGQSSDYAEFRIDLLTTPVPEPATWLLLACGLLPLLLRRGRAS